MPAPVAATPIVRWVNFYVLTGSAAAALTGLQFVVIALLPQMRPRGPSPTGGIAAFSTPTIVHFSTVLLISALLCAPWDGAAGAATLTVLCGAAGLVYCGLVSWRAWRLDGYQMVAEDWIWHIALPLLVHLTVFVSGLALISQPVSALYALAAAVLLLLFIGIHNSWDTVTFLVVQNLESERKAEKAPEPPSV